jgi:hypothetical protein
MIENHRFVPIINENGNVSGSYLLINYYIRKTNFMYDAIILSF